MRLLIVEDDLEASEAMARGLAEAGHDCTAAENGEAGLTAAQRGQFDVLIVDRMLPKLDGVATPLSRSPPITERPSRFGSMRSTISTS